MSDPVTIPLRPRRRVFLFTSLAFNLFLVGVIVAGTVINWQNRAFGVFAGQNPFAPHNIVRAVPPDARADVEAILRAHERDQREALREVRRSRMEVYRLMGDAYDRSAIIDALNHMREADAALAQATQEAILDVLEKVSPDVRKSIAEHIRENGRDRHRDRRRGPEGDGPPPEMGPEMGPEGGEPPPPPPP